MFETAIIGGTGLGVISGAKLIEQREMTTPYGALSAAVQVIEIDGARCAFLQRHGLPHHIPPHRINYRANLWALRELQVRRVIAVNAVGGIGTAMSAGRIAIPDQIVDYTYGREHTFSDGETGSVLEHVDFTHPYTPSLRAVLLEAARRVRVEVVDGGVYGATQGPRLESVAEIARMARDGCDLVGMTGMPEAGLARELGLEYAALCLVVNPAAGLAPGEITMDDIRRVIDSGMGRVQTLLAAALGI